MKVLLLLLVVVQVMLPLRLMWLMWLLLRAGVERPPGGRGGRALRAPDGGRRPQRVAVVLLLGGRQQIRLVRQLRVVGRHSSKLAAALARAAAAAIAGE